MNYKTKKTLSRTAVYIICIIATFLVLFPFFLVILTSFKSVEEAAIVDLSMPKQILWENFSYVMEQGNLLRAFKNSLLITGCSVLLTVLVSSVTAFVLTRRSDKLSKVLSNYFLIGMIAPLALIPEVIIVKMIGLSGTYLSIILIHVASRMPLSIMIYSGVVKGIPRSLDESAMLEGCGFFRMFFQVVFPLLKPAIFTNVIIVFMGVWNDFQISLYFVTDIAKNTVPLSIYSFVGYMTYKWNYVCAFIVLSILPILIVYCCAQKYIVDGMIAGAVKN
ncbi:carbohydrate ABC transporter permease [Faecalicatena sp. AGMB00832]|uniref:Carbohydrate ABC transporter permease n=1 Tax=Faecalicatena faecalis TaxID=2726362 RepID=A0ABS6D3Z0_9FIRM|nr:carbohydrate ABC transporter permease [Faecalicatena faecalis]MBU3876313.1 carbohydrate ABC transporter permease [Faecalicatena faecalis]